MDNKKNKECKYQNICVNFNDNLYSKCPVFDMGNNKCCYSILYDRIKQLKEENDNLKLILLKKKDKK